MLNISPKVYYRKKMFYSFTQNVLRKTFIFYKLYSQECNTKNVKQKHHALTTPSINKALNSLKLKFLQHSL